MKKTHYLAMFACAVIMLAVVVKPADAGEWRYPQKGTVMHGEYSTPNWIYFGGCEDNNNTACINDAGTWRGTFFNVGDYNVKQGVYQLAGPFDAQEYDPRGWLLVKYSYKFTTTESKDSSSIDKGVIKLKNATDDTIVHQKLLTPVNGSTTWTDVSVRLPGSLISKKLQFVVEAENDGENLTTMKVDKISVYHKLPPAIGGRVTYRDAGKCFPAEGALVALQNRTRTKTLKWTTTDADGYYHFYPVKRRRKFVVASTYGEHQGIKRMKHKTRRGVYRNRVHMECK
ncbi:MAG: hypothetical protein ABIG66_00245 [Candidatus Kerfeldbacteria bacterium]